MIEAAVFDFGGVISESTLPLVLKATVEELKLPWPAFVAGFAKHRLLYDRGTITLSEMYDRILADAGLELDAATKARLCADDTASWLSRNEATLEWMRSLKARGLKIGILTNMAPAFAPLFRRHFAGYVALADAMVVSGEVNLVKPMPAIYALLRERIALEAHELCFIDDLEINCAAARECGWQAVCFKDNRQAADDLERMLK